MTKDALQALRAQIAAVPRNTKTKAQGAKRLGTETIMKVAAPMVLACCLQGEDFTATEIWQSTPELAINYTNSNAIASVLGVGIKGCGLKLHSVQKGKDRAFLACKENALIALGQVLDDLDGVAEHLDYEDAEDLIEAVKALPSGL